MLAMMNGGWRFPPEWEAFLMSVDLGILPSSFHMLRYGLARWKRWLDENALKWRQVTPEQAQQWVDTLLATCARSTVNLRLWPPRLLYRWLAREGRIGSNPFEFLTLPINHKRPRPRFLPTEEEVERLLEMPDTGTHVGIRDRAILELLYACGLRASELLSLNVCSVTEHFRQRALRVTGKGQTERFVIYHETAQQWLSTYFRQARPALLEHAGVRFQRQFFVNHRSPDARLSYGVFRRMIRCYADAAGLPRLTAHSLRHACASHMYCNGSSMEFLRHFLGHAEIDTTATYIHLSAAYLRDQYHWHHPRGDYYVPPEQASQKRREFLRENNRWWMARLGGWHGRRR